MSPSLSLKSLLIVCFDTFKFNMLWLSMYYVGMPLGVGRKRYDFVIGKIFRPPKLSPKCLSKTPKLSPKFVEVASSLVMGLITLDYIAPSFTSTSAFHCLHPSLCHQHYMSFPPLNTTPLPTYSTSSAPPPPPLNPLSPKSASTN